MSIGMRCGSISRSRKPGLQPVERGLRPGDDAQLGRVDAGHVEVLAQQAAQFVGGQRHAEHAAPGTVSNSCPRRWTRPMQSSNDITPARQAAVFSPMRGRPGRRA